MLYRTGTVGLAFQGILKELGVPFAMHGGADLSPEPLFDGHSFDPASPENYAVRFPITSIHKSPPSSTP